MAYDEGLAQRLRELLSNKKGIVEKKMFGGLAFMKNGNMMLGVNKSNLMARVGKENYMTALSKEHSKEMDFTGKALSGFVYISEKGCEEDSDLNYWIEVCETYVDSLPKKH